MEAVKNVKILHQRELLMNKALLYDNRIIDIIDEQELDKYAPVNIIDGDGMYLSAGFIDVHVHGCSSYDVMDTNEDTLNIISQNLTRTGVTSFLPTTMTMDFNKIELALDKIARYMGKAQGAQILGAHMEGPFINRLFKGAHDENYIISSDENLIEKYKNIIKIITVAPEIDGSTELIKYCCQNGIIASIGHTAAEYEKAMDAVSLGASHFTHTFNAMTPLKHREPGAVGAAMLSDATCELIADNIHVHPAAQKLLVKVKGVGKVVLVTDAMRACLMCDGMYNLGGQEVIVRNREARMKNGTLAGSVLTLNIALKHIVENTGLPLTEAIEMLTLNQARLLKLDHTIGSLLKGYEANLTLFDDQYNIHYTIVNGTIVYKS